MNNKTRRNLTNLIYFIALPFSLVSCLFTSDGTTSWSNFNQYPMQFASYTPGSPTQTITLPSVTASPRPNIYPYPQVNVMTLDGTQINTGGVFSISLTPYLDASCTQIAPNSNGPAATVSTASGVAVFNSIAIPYSADPLVYYLQASGPNLISTCSGGIQFQPLVSITTSTPPPAAVWTNSSTEIPVPYSDGGSSAAGLCTASLSSGVNFSLNTYGGNSVNRTPFCSCKENFNPFGSFLGMQCVFSLASPNQSNTSAIVNYTITEGSYNPSPNPTASSSVSITAYDWTNAPYSLSQTSLSNTSLALPSPLPNPLPTPDLNISYTTLPAPTGAALTTSPSIPKWAGGVLAPNGKIYGIPALENRVIEIDPNALSNAQYIAITGSTVTTSDMKWFGGVLHSYSNRIYGIPYSNASINSFLEINPGISPGTASAATVGTSIINTPLLESSSPWAAGVFYPGPSNLALYMIPNTPASQHIASLTLSGSPGSYSYSNQSTSTSWTTGGAASNLWAGGVLAPSGAIYAIPAQSLTVLKITTTTTPTTTTLSVSSVDSSVSTNKWSGAVLANNPLSGNAKIYAIPDCSNQILIIDPNTDTISSLSNAPSLLTNTCGKYKGAALGIDGRIYAFPAISNGIVTSAYSLANPGTASDPVLIIDPRNDSASFGPSPNSPNPQTSSRWQGAVTATDGSVIGIPGTEAGIVQLKFTYPSPNPQPSPWNTNVPLTPYMNKY